MQISSLKIVIKLQTIDGRKFHKIYETTNNLPVKSVKIKTVEEYKRKLYKIIEIL